MSSTTLLVELSLILSIGFAILFFMYYKYLNAKTEADVAANEDNYYDYGSYLRENKKNGGFLSPNNFVLNDSKSIGMRYIMSAIVFFFIAGSFGLLMRVSLVEPNPTLFAGREVLYDVLTTEHSILMIYMWALGGAMGIAYYLLPSFLKVNFLTGYEATTQGQIEATYASPLYGAGIASGVFTSLLLFYPVFKKGDRSHQWEDFR